MLARQSPLFPGARMLLPLLAGVVVVWVLDDVPRFRGDIVLLMPTISRSRSRAESLLPP